MSIENFIRNEVRNKGTELNSLYRKPRPDPPSLAPHYQLGEPNTIHQADILYIPEDKEYKYILVVVDVFDKKIDCEPIKELGQEYHQVFEGLRTIYNRGILKKPKILSLDQGNEFKDKKLLEYLKEHRINLKLTLAGRHRQNASVERANEKVGTLIHKLQANEEMLTGHIVKTWVNDLPDIVKALNNNLPPPLSKEQSDKLMFDSKVDYNIIPLGTKVRTILDKPENTYNQGRLSGTFRNSDIRFSRDIKRITNIFLTPNLPVMYEVDNNTNVSYTKNQLQVIKRELRQPNPEYIRGSKDIYIIEKILDSRTVGRKKEYLVKWYGYANNAENNTWESTNIFSRTDKLKEMRRLFNQNQQ